jgi:glycosyltransferase involved in cell wall biosynthesis
LDIPRELVRTNVLPELVARIPTLLSRGPSHWYYRKGEYFDRWAARQLKPCDVFVGWSGFSEHTIRRVRQMGGTVVLVRGSAHILTQKQLVDEERVRFGYHETEMDPLTVEKEMREYELSDYIAMPSKFCERSFLARGVPAEKLLVWPLGADTRRFRPPAQERRDEPFRVLYVGEINLQKGIYYLLEAFRRAALPNSELLLVGAVKPTVLPLLRNQPASVKVPGVIRFPKLLDYYQNASIFVLPSVQDGFGQVVMQAMAAGLPVLVSSNAGASEAVRDGENGYVFEARDVDALTARLEQLYRDLKLRREMGHNALSSARGYTWDNYGAAVESSLLDITGHREAA